MGDFNNKKRGIRLTNAPDNLSKEEGTKLFDFIQANIGSGTADNTMSIDYGYARSKMEQDYVHRGMRGYGETQDTSVGSVTSEADAMLNKTTGKGMIDSFVRKALPTAIASAFGLPFVAADKLTEIISEPVAKAMNERLGTNQLSWSETKDKWFDKAGLERPDTTAEQIYSRMGEGIGDVMGTLSGAQALKAAGGLAPTAQAAIGDQLTYRPLSQATGALVAPVGSELGGQGAQALAKKAGAGERGQAAANVTGQLLGGMGSDMAAGAMLNPVEQRLEAAVTPLRGREANILSKSEPYTEDVPLSRSELMRETSQREATKAQKWETRPGGAGELHYDRYNSNQKLLADTMDNYGIEVSELGRTSKYSEDLMNDFLDTRQAKLTKNVELKRDVIDRLTEGGEKVPITGTDEYLDGLIAVNDELGTSAAKRRAKFWRDFQAEIHDKNFDQLETIRKDYAHEIKVQDMPDEMQQDLRKVYRELVGGYDPEIDDFVDGDMGRFIKETGEEADYNQWRSANANLSEMAREFSDKALYSLLEEGKKNPENIQWEDIDKLLTNPNASQTEKLFSRLSPEGQGTAKVAIMSKIFQESNPSDLSPTMFAQKVQQYGDNLGVVLDKEEIDQLSGLKKFLESTAYSEQFVRSGTGAHSPSVNVMPGTGPLVSHGMRQVGVAGLGVSAAGMGIMGKIATNAQTPKVRNLMAHLAAVDPGSANEAELIKLIAREIDATEELNQLTSTGSGEQTSRIVNPGPTGAEIKQQENLMRQEERQR